MSTPFETAGLAAGYAAFRPPLHALILERARAHFPSPARIARALDVGCGAGLSTKALDGMADHRIGIDPAVSMVHAAAGTAPGAAFVAARAEALPFASHSIGLITAAGSLNYADVRLFFQEASRTLSPGGLILVYDFSPGRTFRNSAALDDWFGSFLDRYPWPPGEALHLDPETLAEIAVGFRVSASEHFEIPLTLTPAFYLEYILTETNVAFAQRSGHSEADIRDWCAHSLARIWGGQAREVLFRGYFACLVPAAG